MICTGQDFIRGEFGNVFGRERIRPWNASLCAVSGAAAAEFSIEGRLLGVRLFPIVPTFRANRIRHLGTDKNRFGEVSPTSAEIGFHACFAGDFAIGENEAVRLILWGRSSGDVALTQHVDGTAIEKSGGAAEDEVDVALNVAVLEKMPAAINENGVLPAEEPAAAEDETVSIRAQRERLANGASMIRECDVFPKHAIPIDLDGRRAKRADDLSIRPGQIRVQIVGDAG